jgi:phage terminase large subunit-like protein
MSSPVKAIEALVLQKKLNHNHNPVLGWNVSNVLIVQDAAENVKMDKSKSQERIDGAVALAMAIGRAETYKDEEVDWESLVG